MNKAKAHEPYRHIFLREGHSIIAHGFTVLYSDGLELVPLHSPLLSKKQKRAQKSYVERVRCSIENVLNLRIDSTSEILVDRVIRGACFLRVIDFPLYLSGNISLQQKEVSDYIPIKEYLMVNCLFGSHLRGVLSCGKETACINYFLDPHTRFESLVVDDHDHPYETTMWVCLKMLSSYLNPQRISIHLPCEDYLLFGLHLLERRIINSKLYEIYAEQVHKRAERHRKIIHSINPHIEITSPFSGLFISPQKNLNSYIDDVLQSKNGHVWKTAMECTGIPSSFHTLLRLGNLVFIGQSSLKHQPFEVCALYPSSERMIIHHYSKLLSKQLPSISSLIWLPPVSGWPTLFQTPSGYNATEMFNYWYK